MTPHPPEVPPPVPPKTSVDWTKASTFVALASLIVSIFALYIAHDGSRATNQIASQALETARQANQISMGIAREPAIVEFYSVSESDRTFDLTTTKALQTELSTTLSIKNVGKRAVDAVAFEFIGMNGLTLQHSDPKRQFDSLPAFSTRLDLYATLQPDARAHIDVRRYIVHYLSKLSPQLPDRNSVYRSVVNVVLSPKATTETTPSPAGLNATTNDRVLIVITFAPSVLESAEAKALLQSTEVAHRVYAR